MAKVAHIVPVDAWEATVPPGLNGWHANVSTQGRWGVDEHSGEDVQIEAGINDLIGVCHHGDIAGTIERVHAAWLVLMGEAVAVGPLQTTMQAARRLRFIVDRLEHLEGDCPVHVRSGVANSLSQSARLLGRAAPEAS